MALRRSRSEQAEDAIMRGVIEIKAFEKLACVGKDPLDTNKGCKEAVFVITIVMDGKDGIACGGYCPNHLFMLEPYVVLSKERIGLEDIDAKS